MPKLIPEMDKLLCAWCKKVVIDKSGGGRQEVNLWDTVYKVSDFESHGICSHCKVDLEKEAAGIKKRKNPPEWIQDKKLWTEARGLAEKTYGSSGRPRNYYAIVVQIYKTLGGRIRSKAKKNPSDPELEAVLELFKEWQELEATVIEVHEAPDWPSSFAKLGTLHSVVYKSDKWDGQSRLYEHKFKKQPVLVASSDGRLFILGGNYKVTNRGIVG